MVHAGNWTQNQPGLCGGEASVKPARPAWCEVLDELNQLVGSPGLRTIQHHAALVAPAHVLSKSTVGNLLAGTTNPRVSSVEAFVYACLHYGRARGKRLPPDREQPAYWIQRFHDARADSNHTDLKSSGSPKAPAGGPGYRFEAFAGPIPRTAPHRYTPSYLLDSRYEVVPFHDRRERQMLEMWLEGRASRTSVQLVHGDGGQGKSGSAARIGDGL